MGCSTDEELPVLASGFSQQAFAGLSMWVQENPIAQCQALHAEWHRVFAQALHTYASAAWSARQGTLSCSLIQADLLGEPGWSPLLSGYVIV